MATGKTHAKYIGVTVWDYADQDRVISPSVTDVTVPMTADTQDTTGYSDGVKQVSIGHPDQPLTISGVYDTTALVGSHTVFSRIVGILNASSRVTVDIGIRALSIGGEPQYDGLFYCTSLVYSGDMTYVAELVPATTTAPIWTTF